MNRRHTWNKSLAALALVASCAIDDATGSSMESEQAQRSSSVVGASASPAAAITLFDVTLSEQDGSPTVVTGLVGETSVSLLVDEVRSLDGSESPAAPVLQEKRQADETTRVTCDCWDCGTKKKPKRCCICTP